MRDCRANELEAFRLAMHALVRGKIPMRVLRTKKATCLVFPVPDGPQLGFLHLVGAAKELDRRRTLGTDAIFAMRAKLVSLFEVLKLAAPPLLR